MSDKIISACGNDCSICPRYVKPPYEKTEEQLHKTAELWYRMNYRDHVVTNEEISCTGCKKDNWCRYQVVECVSEKGIENCGQCAEYPCDNLKSCFSTTMSYEKTARVICLEDEYSMMSEAFFEKEKNLNHVRDQEALKRAEQDPNVQETLAFYNKNAENFIAHTADVDFHEIQDKFLEKLPEQASILDFGCGSGRDTKYFLDKGHPVTAMDGSAELCKAASELTGICVRRQYFQELSGEALYDAIWACASILHVKKDELPEVVGRMSRALCRGGLMYMSFKYGDFEGLRNGRYFTDFNEENFRSLMSGFPELQIEELWKTRDVRPGRSEEIWLNAFVRKSL